MNLLRSLRKFTRRLPAEARAVRLRELLMPLKATRTPDARQRIVVQCVEDEYYLGLFSVLCDALRKRRATTVDLFVPRSFNADVGAGWKLLFLRSFPLGRLLANQWVRLYDIAADRVGYRSTSLRHPLGDLHDGFRSWRAWRSLQDVGQLDRLSIDGLACGDLVIDSYLRFRPSPRVRLDDRFLAYLIWQAHRDVRRARRYFAAARPRLYLASYTTYIQHGIAARAALEAGVPVLTFGNLQQFGKLLGLDDTFHTRDARSYRTEFAALANGPELLAEAQKQLETRLSGGIDLATSYMAASAYRHSDADAPDVSDAVIVFLHDFYDSPHVYADLVFPDFWDWICVTIDALQANGIKFLVKPHPNQIALSDAVIGELRNRYPTMRMVPSGVTNRQLVDGGMACAVTVYGTVGHEMAYFGIPTIACARHPHVAFDFCETAHDRAGYTRLLARSLELRRDDRPVAEMQTQALQFYVMHNLSLEAGQAALRDAMVATWKTCLDQNCTAESIRVSLDRIVALPAFDGFIDKVAGVVAA